MLDINNAAPCANRAQKVVKIVDRKILNNVIYLLSVYEEAVGADFKALKKSLKLATEQLDVCEEKLSSIVHSVHSQLLTAIRNNDPDSALKAIKQLPHKLFVNKGIELTCYVEDEIYSPTIKADYNKMYPHLGFKGVSPDDDVAPSSLKSLDYALNVLKSVSPEYYDELSTITDRIMLFKADFSAGTCFDTFGLFYVNQLEPEQNWTRYFGDIVHESSHILLYGISTIDPIVKDKDGTYITPLRKEPRPLYMAFHQMFVLARTLMIVNKVKEHSEYTEFSSSMDESYTNSAVRDDFDKAYKVIYDNKNKLTEIGLRIMESCKEIAA